MVAYILNYFGYHVSDFLCPSDTKEYFAHIIKSELIPDNDCVLNLLNRSSEYHDNKNDIFIIGNLLVGDKSTPIVLKVGDMVINGVCHRSGMKYTVNDNKISFVSLTLYLRALINNQDHYFKWMVHRKSYDRASIQQINDILNKTNDCDNIELPIFTLFSDLLVLDMITFVYVRNNNALKHSGINITIIPMTNLTIKIGTNSKNINEKNIICVPRTK